MFTIVDAHIGLSNLSISCMHILQQIIAQKKQEITQRKQVISFEMLEKSPFFTQSSPYPLKAKLQTQAGIIAEFKLKSPSKQQIRAISPEPQARIQELLHILEQYQQAGASAVSILTDEPFFGGSLQDITTARPHLHIPILRKDFILDEYQLWEAKSAGANLILLIAACLTPQAVKHLAKQAHNLGLEVLLEVHTQQEIQTHLCPEVDLIGVNNRNLNSFVTDIHTSVELAQYIPQEFVKISESGIETLADIQIVRAAGYCGFLIGEALMKAENITATLRNWVAYLSSL